MIHEIDQVLRAMIGGRLLPGLISDVEFAAPTSEWAARRNAPTVNAFLYDIREDAGRRESGRRAARDDRGRVTHRTKPTRWFQLTYLLTAWTTRPEDEHRLLSALLGLLLRYDALPLDDLTPELTELAVTLPMQVGTTLAESRSASELWSALGGEPKPSIDLTVLTPIPDPTRLPVSPPVTEIAVEVRDGDGAVDAVTGPSTADGRPARSSPPAR